MKRAILVTLCLAFAALVSWGIAETIHENLIVNARIGVGTDKPLTAVHTPETGIQIGTSDTESNNFHFTSDIAGAERGLRLYNGNYGYGKPIFTALPSGEFGVGTLTPSAKLTVYPGLSKPTIIGGKAISHGVLVPSVSGRTAYTAVLENPWLSDGTNGDAFFNAIVPHDLKQLDYKVMRGQMGSMLKDTSYITIGGDAFFAGTVMASEILCLSDASLKQNIKPIKTPIHTIRQIPGREYGWDNSAMGTGTQLGVIAQEVEQVLPGAVTTGADGLKSVAYNHLVALLIEGVKAQQDQIDSLNARLAALENKQQD